MDAGSSVLAGQLNEPCSECGRHYGHVSSCSYAEPSLGSSNPQGLTVPNGAGLDPATLEAALRQYADGRQRIVLPVARLPEIARAIARATPGEPASTPGSNAGSIGLFESKQPPAQPTSSKNLHVAAQPAGVPPPRLREIIVDTLLNDSPDDTVLDIADRIVGRLLAGAAPGEAE